MSFKTEAAKVRGTIASGGYMKKSDPFAGFADQVVAGMMRSDAAKRQEELELKREKRDEKRRIKAAADAAELVANKQTKLANFWLASNSQIDKTPETKAAVLSAVQLGNFDNIGDLSDYMKKQSKYVPGVVGEPEINEISYDKLKSSGVTTEMEDGALTTLRPVTRNPEQRTDTGGTMVDVTPMTANSDDTAGRIEFGTQPVLYDLGDLRKDNWKGEYQDLLDSGDTANANRVQAWAVGQDFFEIVPNFPTSVLLGKEVDGNGGLLEIKSLIPTGNVDALKHIDGIITVKKLTVDNAQIWNKPEELITVPLDELLLAQGLYPDTTQRGKNIASAIESRRSLESANSMAAFAEKLDQSVEYYANAIALLKGPGEKLDQNNQFYEQNIRTLQNLITLQSLAQDKKNSSALDTEKARSTKDLFLNAKYAEDGYFVLDAKTNSYKIPTSEAIAKIEAEWKTLTDISKQPEAWFTDKNLLALPPEDLKVIIDTGILDGKPKALETVTAMYTSRVDQEKSRKLSEALDPNGRIWQKTTDIDSYLAGLGPEIVTEAALNDFARVRSVLAKAEGLIAEGEDMDAYQLAFRTYLTLPENKGKTGQEFIDVMTNWETYWKDQSAKTPDAPTFNAEFVSGEIFKANENIKSSDPTVRAAGEKFLAETLPSMIAGLVGVNNTSLNQQAKLKFLLDSGVEEGFARATVGGTTQIVGDPITGDKTVVNFDSFSASAPEEIQTPVAEIAANITQLSETGFPTVVGGKEITVSREDLLESKAFMDREKTPGGNLDVRKAFGSGAFLKWAASNTTALVGWETFPELTQMQTYIEGLNNAAMRTISVAIEGSRDSVFNKDAIMKTLPQASSLFENRTRAAQKLRGTVEQLQRAMDVAQGTLDGRTTPTMKSKAFIQLNALKPLFESYDNLLNAWSAAEDSANVPISPDLQLTETVSTGPNKSLTQTSTVDGIPVFSFGEGN